MMGEEFLKELVEAVTKEIVKSPILASEVARRIMKDTPTLEKAISMVSEETLAKAIANRVIYLDGVQKGSTHGGMSVSTFLKKANEKAQDITAERMHRDFLSS